MLVGGTGQAAFYALLFLVATCNTLAMPGHVKIAQVIEIDFQMAWNI